MTPEKIYDAFFALKDVVPDGTKIDCHFFTDSLDFDALGRYIMDQGDAKELQERNIIIQFTPVDRYASKQG